MLENYQKFQAYQQASHNVGKAAQIIMLYDGMIRFMQQANFANNDGQIEQRFNALQKVVNIITGLQSSLDLHNYPEISASLYDYYETIYIRTFNLFKGGKESDYLEVIDDLKKMRAAWSQAEQTQLVQQPSAEVNKNVQNSKEIFMQVNDFGSMAINA